MESPAVLVMAILFATGKNNASFPVIIFLVLWMSHYIHRTFLYPFMMKGGDKRFPVILIVFAITFNSINAYINGRYLFHFSGGYPESWLLDLRFISGIVIFFIGLAINVHSDSILRSLRKPESVGYKIPCRGLFKYVSSPNYFGEILEWIGWAVLTWSIAGLAFAVFTIANLLPRAFANHKWYKNKFPEYPDKRKILIPFIL
jgi:steroid 5-alpha reductase family enzyme